MKPPRDSQWQAIQCVDRHVLVAAGAGTGKTHTVVGRILYLLGEEFRGQRVAQPLRLRDIAAITFTNRAAADLKEKLRRELRDSGRRQAANEVDLARIGTIHSFCGDILRQFALRSTHSPIRRILEEGEAAARVAATARDTLVEAVSQHSVPGLDSLLASWETVAVDGWVAALLARPELVRRMLAEIDSLAPVEAALVRLTDAARQRLERWFELESAIDFDRMILWTRDLLRDDPLTRRALQRELRTLIIDEFQDVDPLQKEIAYLLADPASGRRDTPRLMLVGDPKQSIYRFRHADVTVWHAVERDFQEQGLGEVTPLEDNFRSVPAVLGFVDAAIGPALNEPIEDPDLADYEVPFQAVTPVRSPAADPCAVELLLVPPDEDGRCRLLGDLRPLEAAAIARRLRELHQAGTAWNEMAVLLATWSSLDVYHDALRQAGIPTYALRDEGFLECREVVDMILALETIRDPTDDRALLGFLRSPFVGLRDDSLLRIVRQARSPYWRRLQTVDLPGGADDDGELARLARGQALIQRYTTLRDRLPTATLLSNLLEESGYLAQLTLRGDDGLQPLANVRQFLSMARAAGAASVGELLRVLQERRKRKDRVGGARLYGETDDVVTITSIHVAKGLEWPVVCWADLAAGASYPNDKLLVARDRLRLGEPHVPARDQPAEWQALRNRLKAEADAERKRLWYVATTRARDRLILAGIPLGHGGNIGPIAQQLRKTLPLDGLSDGAVVSYGDDGQFEAIARLAHPAAPVDADAAEAGAAGSASTVTSIGPGTASPVGTLPDLLPPELLPPPLEPIPIHAGPTRHSATGFLTHDRCPRRHWLKYVAGIREPDARMPAEALISAVQRGQIVHDVLERYEEELELDALLEDAIGRWDETAPPPETERGLRYRAHLTEEVTRALPAYRELDARPHARRELPFLLVQEDGSAIQGRIDLAAPTPDGAGFDLLDVKTSQCDVATARTKAAQYRPQRDVYVTATAAITRQPVRDFSFLFSHTGHAETAAIDAAETSTAGQRLAAAMSEIAAGRAPLTQHPHECRFCGYRRVHLCPGVPLSPNDPEALLARLAHDRFRRRFRLGPAERATLRKQGRGTILEHARRFIRERLAPARPAQDGRQTPYRGHPVFIAQHATATCCRRCLERWHGISSGAALTPDQIDYVLDIIDRWLRARDDDPSSAPPRPPHPQPGGQLDLF